MHNSRFTIGLFIDVLEGMLRYETYVWHGLSKSAELRNANLIVAAGGSIEKSSVNKYEKTRNKLYSLINDKSIDGIVFASGNICNYISKEEYAAFCSRYQPLPMLSIGAPVEGMAGLMVDNQAGLKKLIMHLYEVHNCRKFAFIRGPEGNDDAAERFTAYSDTLEKLGIPFNPDMVFVGNYLEPAGIEAVKFWLDEKHLDFQAIIASNDNMAIGAMKELIKRGIKVPDTIAVTGFDDTEDAASFTPPLTTVRQPIYEMSRRAGEKMIDFLEGKSSMTGNDYIPAEVVFRQSCGCKPASIQNFTSFICNKTQKDYRQAFAAEKMMILTSLTDVLRQEADLARTDQLHNIVNALFSEILDKREGLFFSSLDTLLQEVISMGEDISIWQNIVTVLRNSTLPLIGEEEDYARAYGIFQKSNIYISELALRIVSVRKLNTERLNYELSLFAQAMSSTFDRKELEEALVRELPRLDIPSFYISLYEGSDTASCRIYAAYNDGARITPNENEAVYPSDILIPKSILPSQRRYTMIAESLYFRNDHLGLILMEAGPMEGMVYESALTQISGSLEGGTLVMRSKDAELALEKRSLNIETVVMPMIDTIKQVSAISAEKMEFIRQIAGKTGDSYFKIKETNNIIEKAALNINNILQIINIINEISTTVNLVALNASIEATHAGEFGTGFAIIAREIKKLSDSTKKNSEEIARTLKDVVKNVQDTVSIGKESLVSFEEQRSGVETLIESLEVITKNMDSLSDSSKKILEVMDS
jgi:DNA-binding LacI/PurR family transcriptional regulator